MLVEKIELKNNACLNGYIIDKTISYKVEKKRPALIICPGGGYLFRAAKEREPIALEFMSKGYHCFVLDYTVGFHDRNDFYKDSPSIDENAQFPLPVLQLMESVHLIKTHAEEWGIDDKNIFLMGFSAGAHVCASLGSRWNDKTLLDQLDFKPVEGELKPKGVVLCYPFLNMNSREFLQKNETPEIKKVGNFMNEFLFQTETPTKEQIVSVNVTSYLSPETAPAFIWHTVDDKVVDAEITTEFVKKLQEYHVPVEYHLYTSGIHGLALANEIAAKREEDINETIQTWVPLAQAWMRNLW